MPARIYDAGQPHVFDGVTLPVGSSAEPLYFAMAGGGQAFGWYHPARGGETRDAAVLVCNPLGHEWLCSYRTLRCLAGQLADSGFPVLRFDYPGTGDSTGSDRDPGLAAAWLASVRRAVAELRERSGRRRVVVVGVRFGATLAALATATSAEVNDLVLIAPCATGRGYLRELRALQGAMNLPAAPADVVREPGAEESAGFFLSPETAEAVSAMKLEDARGPNRGGVLVIERDDLPADPRTARALMGWSAAVEIRRLPGYPGMMADPHKTVVPDTILETIVGWVGARHPTLAGAPPVEMARPVGLPRATFPWQDGGGRPQPIEEQPIFFGPEGRMFGILTRPAGRPSRPTGIVLLNPGAVHRVGVNRMWVTWARGWAARGYTVLRIDVSGLGDSPPHAGTEANTIYSAHAVEDVRQAVAAVRAWTGIDRFVLAGLCSGAYLSFHAALEGPPVAGSILINPAAFYFKEGMSLEVTAAKAYRMTSHYKEAFFRRETWGKLLRGGIDLRLFARSVAVRVCDVVTARTQQAMRWARLRVSAEDLGHDLRRLAASGHDLLCVFAEGEPGLDILDRYARWTVRRLRAQRKLRLEVMPATDHTFTPVWSQGRLFTLLTEHLLERHP